MTLEVRAPTGAFLEASIKGDRVEARGVASTTTNTNKFTGTAGADLGQVLADTGNLVAGNWRFLILLQCNLTIDVDIERRDVADGASLQTIRVTLPADAPVTLELSIDGILANESVRVTLQTEITTSEIVNSVIQGLV